MTDEERKASYVYSALEFFPEAFWELGKSVELGQRQHIKEGGKPQWKREISNQHMQSLTRHLLDYASGEKYTEDGIHVLAQVIWRASAQIQLDNEQRRLGEKSK